VNTQYPNLQDKIKEFIFYDEYLKMMTSNQKSSKQIQEEKEKRKKLELEKKKRDEEIKNKKS